MYDWPPVDVHSQIVNRRQDLYNALQRLESSVARASGQVDWIDQVREAVTNLETALQEHVVEIEAPQGLFNEVIDRAPHLSPDVDTLRKEHDEMLTACRSALNMLATSDDVDAGEIRRKVLGILGRLAIHRQSGAELLYDTYNIDLDTGD